jgi:hypothetical protein
MSFPVAEHFLRYLFVLFVLKTLLTSLYRFFVLVQMCVYTYVRTSFGLKFARFFPRKIFR